MPDVDMDPQALYQVGSLARFNTDPEMCRNSGCRNAMSSGCAYLLMGDKRIFSVDTSVCLVQALENLSLPANLSESDLVNDFWGESHHNQGDLHITAASLVDQTDGLDPRNQAQGSSQMETEPPAAPPDPRNQAQGASGVETGPPAVAPDPRNLAQGLSGMVTHFPAVPPAVGVLFSQSPPASPAHSRSALPGLPTRVRVLQALHEGPQTPQQEAQEPHAASSQQPPVECLNRISLQFSVKRGDFEVTPPFP